MHVRNYGTVSLAQLAIIFTCEWSDRKILGFFFHLFVQIFFLCLFILFLIFFANRFSIF